MSARVRRLRNALPTLTVRHMLIARDAASVAEATHKRPVVGVLPC